MREARRRMAQPIRLAPLGAQIVIVRERRAQITVREMASELRQLGKDGVGHSAGQLLLDILILRTAMFDASSRPAGPVLAARRCECEHHLLAAMAGCPSRIFGRRRRDEQEQGMLLSHIAEGRG